jgi:hypothetical protein
VGKFQHNIAYWVQAGVPMVTYPGESMASRAAGSFALSVGCPEMQVLDVCKLMVIGLLQAGKIT